MKKLLTLIFSLPFLIGQADVKNVNPNRYLPPVKSWKPWDWNLSVFGEMLYWLPSEDGLDYAIKAHSQEYITTFGGVTFLEGEFTQLGNAKVLMPDFTWDLGFRVGGGVLLPLDDWDVVSSWTHFQSTATNHATANNPVPSIQPADFLFPLIFEQNQLFELPNGPCLAEAAQARWDLHFNCIDFEMGRNTAFSKSFNAHFIFGVKGAKIDQDYRVAYENFHPGNFVTQISYQHLKMHNNFKGIGPLAGCDVFWKLYERQKCAVHQKIRGEIGLYGKLAFSLLYGMFDLSRRVDWSSNYTFAGMIPNTKIVPNNVLVNKYHSVKSAADLGLGFCFLKELSPGKILKLKTGWENHLWFGQDQFMIMEQESVFTYRSNEGDLGLQGWNLSIILDF